MRNRPFLVRLALGAALTVVAALFLGACGGSNDSSTATPAAGSPAAVAERFFHWYVNEKSQGRDPMAAAALQANADAAPAFAVAMQTIVAGGRDPMLCSGQVPHAFTVGEPRVTGDRAVVAVASNDAPVTWEVDLERVDSTWRIYNIHCAAG